MEKLLTSECEDGINLDYVRSVFIQMNDLRKEGAFCDVVIECDDGRSFEGHRIVLASASPYFRAMFSHNMQESQQKLVKIQQIESRVMEELLNFSYTGKAKLVAKEHDFIESLLLASNMLQFQQVEDACVKFIREHVTVKSLYKFWQLAQEHPQIALNNVINDFIVKHFAKVVQTPAFLQFNASELKAFLADDNLNVNSETQAFEALLKWIRCNKMERLQNVKSLISQIRLPLLPKHYLTENVMNEAVLKFEDCTQLFKDACEYQNYPERRCLLRSKDNTPRKNTQRYIYVIGGYDRVEERFLNTVDCFDTIAETWLNVAPMTTARIRHGVTVLDGMIYAVGGQCDDDVSVRTVERYDPVANKWYDVTPMNECKGQLAVAVCDGKIYCIGGTDDLLKVSLCSVECYDPVTNMWTSLTPMPTARGALGAATLNGKIYAVGGGDFHVALDTVEVYDPKLDCWSTMPSMNYARGCLGLTCVNNTLYVFGGAHMHNGMMTYLEESIECFDPKLNRWLVISGTEVSCWGVGICSVASVDDADHPEDQSELFIVGGIYEFTEGDKMLRVTVTERQIFCKPFHHAKDLSCRVHTGAVALHLAPGS
ncbi:kelch 18 [Paramuricea clavata]|uniref:Kelch 18 n=1 Tax=Paramuricea clavata TaxID=317549 RepID=A0A6S7J4N0_PARCT|nr:kelch 18 [Paramuricea clavata]